MPYALAFGLAAALVAIAWLCEPTEPSAREENSASESDDAGKRYTVGSNADGGFTFSIERNASEEERTETGAENADESGDSTSSTTEADLLAQETMAHWTRWIGIFTALGLAALTMTLWATQQANAAAWAAVEVTREIGEAQARSYVTLNPLSLTIFDLRPGLTSFSLRFEIVASGQTPIYEVRVKPTLMIPVNGGDPQQPENPRIKDAWRSFQNMRPNEKIEAVSAVACDYVVVKALKDAFPNTGFGFPTFGYDLLVHWVDAFNYELRQRFVVYVNSQSFENHSALQCSIAVVSPIERVKRKQFPVVEWEAEQAEIAEHRKKNKGSA
ncbi:hypothetical protein ACFOOP_14485 [Marinicaulis aureus]|uniref:Uncharacterized protein n=1 Tax=Hyphococcus aureus TaxID=2666033 RepID=A0ABW1L382_9PROT